MFQQTKVLRTKTQRYLFILGRKKYFLTLFRQGLGGKKMKWQKKKKFKKNFFLSFIKLLLNFGASFEKNVPKLGIRSLFISLKIIDLN